VTAQERGAVLIRDPVLQAFRVLVSWHGLSLDVAHGRQARYPPAQAGKLTRGDFRINALVCPTRLLSEPGKRIGAYVDASFLHVFAQPLAVPQLSRSGAAHSASASVGSTEPRLGAGCHPGQEV